MTKRPSPQKFVAPPLRAQARAGDAFIANVGAAVAQIQANRAGAASGRDPEHLHQLRVGIRRLRSTLLACLGADVETATWRDVDAGTVPTNYQRFVAAVREGKAEDPGFRHAANLQKVLDLAMETEAGRRELAV